MSQNPPTVEIPLNMGINLSDPVSKLGKGELRFARNSHYLPESQKLAKLPGRTLFGAMGATVRGLSFVKFRTAGSFLIGAAGTSFYTAPVGTSESWTARATSLSGVGRMEALYHNGTDRVYVVDGVNRLRVWTGSGNMRSGGLTRPSAGTLSFLNNSATLYQSGTTFQMCHTEYDSTTGVESPPSDVARMSASAANGTFKYTFPTATNGSSFDKYRLYRTQHGTGIFYRLAEVASTTLRYYDGDDSEALGSGVDNDTYWGFRTVEDGFLSTQPTAAMVGEPLRANYITVNGTIPIGDIHGMFQNVYFITGVPGYPQDVYFAMPDFPEWFSPVNFLREENKKGDPVSGAGVANDRLIVFTLSSIFRHNTFPFPTSPGFGLGQATREEVTDDHGCVAKRSVVNFGVGQPNNRLFYLSSRGPMMTDGYETWPLNEDLNWSDRYVNTRAMSQAVAVNFPKYQQIWLFVPSRSSTVNDMAFIYHYHPNHRKHGLVGKYTGPAHIRCGAAAVVGDSDEESRLYTADTNTTGNVYLEDNGVTDAAEYDDADGKINWEWETGDIGQESKNRRVQRVFLDIEGDDTFDADLYVAVNKSKVEKRLELDLRTDVQASTTTFGNSDVDDEDSLTYRAGVWKTGTHFRWRMQETAAASRVIAGMEVEVETYGAQK